MQLLLPGWQENPLPRAFHSQLATCQALDDIASQWSSALTAACWRDWMEGEREMTNMDHVLLICLVLQECSAPCSATGGSLKIHTLPCPLLVLEVTFAYDPACWQTPTCRCRRFFNTGSCTPTELQTNPHKIRFCLLKL